MTDRSYIPINNEGAALRVASHIGAITTGLLFAAAIGLKLWATFTVAPLHMQGKPVEWLRPFDDLSNALFVAAGVVFAIFLIATRWAGRHKG